MAFGPMDLPAGPLTKGLKAIFMKAYNEAREKSIISRIATVVPSDSDSEDYSWLGATPAVREFLDERQAKDLANFNYNIKNKTWENTIGVKRTDLEDNKLGMLQLRIKELAIKAAMYPEQLACEFLTGALGSAAWPYLCYDGQGLIDTDHPAPVGGSAQDNREGTTLAIATLWLGISTMLNFRDDSNNILGMNPDILLVEPCLEQTARELVEVTGSATTTTAASVLQKKGIEVIVSPYLFSTTTVANGNWFLIDSKCPVRPLVLQERSAIEFGSLEKDSESGFMREVYYYGTRTRYNVGSGFWPAIFGNAGAG
jgi:phage major head subunit gpT-like protein